MSKKEKKPFFKKKWVWALIALVVIIAVMPTNEKEQTPEEEPPQIENTKLPEQDTANKKVIEEDDKKADSSSEKETSTETLANLVELVLAKNFDDYEISHADNVITVNVWRDGMALELAALQEKGEGPDNEQWMALKNSMVSMADSICNLIDESGREDVILNLNVLNDQNHENALLSMLDNAIFFDAME